MDIAKYKVSKGKGFSLKEYSTFPTSQCKKKERVQFLESNRLEIQNLQSKLYAESKAGLLIIFQAMDGAGKDGAIKYVMSGVNPQGVRVHSFKVPNSTELAHDYLWRVQPCLPERGIIAIFNRSYYEDVLVVKVHELYKNLNILDRCKDSDTITKRYGHICNFEQYLYDNGIQLLKIFLNLSYEEQGNRFLRRLDRPDKNWKFSEGDIKERGYWNDYQVAYEKAITATATEIAPWYIVPADNKPYARMIVSEIVKKSLEALNPEYPRVSDEHAKRLMGYRDKI